MEFDRLESLRIGQELKKIRRQQGLSLAQVEQVTQGRWKAVVIGSYERGDRSVTIGRLAALLAIYQIPLSALFPQITTTAQNSPSPINLHALNSRSAELPLLHNFVHTILRRRGDWNGHLISLRGEDFQYLADVNSINKSALMNKLQTLAIFI